MKPWDIIGWVIVGVGAIALLCVLAMVVIALLIRAFLAFRVWRDRDIEPEVGQEWLDWNWGLKQFRNCKIVAVDGPVGSWLTGRIKVEYSSPQDYNFYSPERWRDRRKMLVKGAKNAK